MKKIAITLASLVLLMAVGAAQTSTAAPPAAPPSAQTQAPGAATQPQSQTAQPSQTKTVDEELQLTPDQKQKIAAIINDENKQMGAIREDTSMSPEQQQAKAMQVRRDGATRIRALLSPEQLQKLTELQDKARQQQSAPSGPPPKQ